MWYICFLTMWYSVLTNWYAFLKNTEKIILSFNSQKWFKPWHIKKTKSVLYMESTHWEPICATLDLRSGVALLGTQPVEYGPTHQTITCFFLLKTKLKHEQLWTLQKQIEVIGYLLWACLCGLVKYETSCWTVNDVWTATSAFGIRTTCPPHNLAIINETSLGFRTVSVVPWHTPWNI